MVFIESTRRKKYVRQTIQHYIIRSNPKYLKALVTENVFTHVQR
ncbi:hypothetical protein BMETH_1633_0 [methanotrophic bacterial endosymbiont of Bathymodiolus sp.]|nr:hypothetical protein BMETH_1633_0 [methanotrophic bacterial endosymbiont of Bathymodiolus sp.]